MTQPLTDETKRKDAPQSPSRTLTGSVGVFSGLKNQRKTIKAGATAAAALLLMMLAVACDSAPVPYGRDSQVTVAMAKPQIWAVAPVINLSGQRAVDPLLQGDIMFQNLAKVNGLTTIPIDKVVAVYAALGIERVESPSQAAIVCSMLGADGLVVTTVTAYDPYNPPKMGGTMTLFLKPGSFAMPNDVDPRQLIRQASPTAASVGPNAGEFTQATGMFDASDGYTREALLKYSYGRTDPLGPMGDKEMVYDMDKYAGFVYRQLTIRLLDQLYGRVSPGGHAPSTEKSSLFPDGGAAGPQPFPSNRR